MFKKGQLAKTKRFGRYVIVLSDNDEDNLVTVLCLDNKKRSYAYPDNLILIGNNFKPKNGSRIMIHDALAPVSQIN